ncbi:MAG: lipopolysaccharide biosynthesis protein [Ignavibacteria bacterium]|nr:lipopolysaccharide biosynthesis protein [Ignavibacteria bacterium]
MSQKRKFLKSTSWLTAGNIVAKLISAVAIPILARILGPERLGAYNFVTSTAQSGMSFMTLGTDVAMHRNGARVAELGPEAVGRLFGVGISFTAAVGALTGLLLYLLREPLSVLLLGDSGSGGWLAVAGLIIAIQPLGITPLLLMASLQEFRGYAMRTILLLLLGNALTIGLAAMRGLDGAIQAAVGTAVLQVFLNYLFVSPLLRRHGIRLRFDNYWSELRSMLRFGFPYYFGNTLLGSLVGIPIMGLLVKSGSLHDLGYLRVAQSMSGIIGFIPATIGPAVITHLMASSVLEEAQYHAMRFGHMRMVWVFLLLATTAFSMLMPVLIVPLFGESYRYAVLPSSIMLWLGLLGGVTTALIQQLLVAGKTFLIGAASTAGVTAWVLLALWLIPLFTFNGYLFAQAAGQVVGAVIVLQAYFRNISAKERRGLRLLVGLTLAGGLMSFAAILTIDRSWILISISAAVSAALAAACIRFVILPGERDVLLERVSHLLPFLRSARGRS